MKYMKVYINAIMFIEWNTVYIYTYKYAENIKYFLPIYDLPFYCNNDIFWRAVPESLPFHPIISDLFSYLTQEISLYAKAGVSWVLAKQKAY